MHGGGWRLPVGFGADDVAAILLRLFSPAGGSERDRVKSAIAPDDARRIPALEAMSRDVDALYARFALPPAGATDADAAREALTPLLAANLDGFAFRRELIQLRRAPSRRCRTGSRKRSGGTKNSSRTSRRLKEEIERLAEDNRRLAEDNRRLADPKAAFDQLPEIVRKYLLKRAFRARR